MRLKLVGIESAVREFERQRDSRTFAAMLRACGQASSLSPRLDRRVDEAIFQAAESPDWRLARSAIGELSAITGGLARKADIIVRGMLSRYESVRIASWGAIYGPALSRAVLRRLEDMPVGETVLFEVLMAIDQMADHLPSPRDRLRRVRFVRRMERRGTRSRLIAWKIEDTLYSELHLNQPRDG